jgi:hypothetical protein
VGVAPYFFIGAPNGPGPAGVPQLGTGVLLDALDGRIINAVSRTNFDPNTLEPVSESIYAAHAVFDGPKNKIVARWYEFTFDFATSAYGCHQWGDIDPGPGIHTFYPTVAVIGQKVAVVFARSAATERPSIYVATRSDNDPLGTLGVPRLVQASTTSYTFVPPGGTLARWGDYFGMVADPVSSSGPRRFWCVGQWVSAQDHWQTRIAKIWPVVQF